MKYWNFSIDFAPCLWYAYRTKVTKEVNLMTDNEKLDLILSEIQGFKQKFDRLEQRIDTLENEIKKINLTLENVTNRNILIIAEGHLDLSRKLDECIRLSSAVKTRQEIQDIYFNMHDNKLKAL